MQGPSRAATSIPGAIATLRGARGSGGAFGNLEPDPQTIRDLYEAIEWLEFEEVNMKGLTISGSTIKFGDGTVCITVEDPDDHNADASNHVTGA